MHQHDACEGVVLPYLIVGAARLVIFEGMVAGTTERLVVDVEIADSVFDVPATPSNPLIEVAFLKLFKGQKLCVRGIGSLNRTDLKADASRPSHPLRCGMHAPSRGARSFAS